jgi:RHS repeat-associated protein
MTPASLPVTTACTGSATAGSILDLKYNFNLGASDNGNVAGITNDRDSTRSQTFTYDQVNRLVTGGTTSSCGANCWGQTFGYDPFGNINKSGSCSFQPTYSYLTNHMTMIGGSVPTYDANGNVTNDFLHTYAWDANGRPVTVDGVGLTYDALGRMVEQNRSGVYTEIVYGPGGGKLALMSGQTLQKAFVPLTGGSTAVYNSSGLAYYRHSDWLGSSRFASTPTRTMYSDGAYAPFGEAYAQSGTADLSFTGMNQDTVPNLYDFAAREYGIQGRWPSPDPAGISSVSSKDPQTWNRYAYVRNSPLHAVDPFGLKMSAPIIGGGGGFFPALFFMYGGIGLPDVGSEFGDSFYAADPYNGGQSGECLVASNGGASISIGSAGSAGSCGDITNSGKGQVGIWVPGTVTSVPGYDSSTGILQVNYTDGSGNATYGTFSSTAGTFNNAYGGITFEYFGGPNSRLQGVASYLGGNGMQTMIAVAGAPSLGALTVMGGASVTSAGGTVAPMKSPRSLITTCFLFLLLAFSTSAQTNKIHRSRGQRSRRRNPNSLRKSSQHSSRDWEQRTAHLLKP